ncbi:MAG: hypothetical protein HC904_13270 [Blastochloris sp.]|nr:hypothetical protein [Blastochloris sp.]
MMRRMRGDAGALELFYFGAEGRRDIAQELSRQAEVDPELVTWMLCGEAVGYRLGSNRNSLMLACVGRAVLGVDDDFLPRFRRSGGREA